jgi:hypothetical protein
MQTLSPTEMQEVAQIIMGLFAEKDHGSTQWGEVSIEQIQPGNCQKSGIQRTNISQQPQPQSLCAVKKTLCIISN